MFILAVFCLTGAAIADQPTRISEVRLEGLHKTRHAFVEQFLETGSGAPLDSTILQGDLQRLRNLRIFREVEYEVLPDSSGAAVLFKFQENATLLPIVNFGSIESGLWFQLGASEGNFLGRAGTLAGYYRYYDRNSFEIFYNGPHLMGLNRGVVAIVNFFATIEPAFLENGTTYYNADRRSWIALIRHGFRRDYKIEFGGGFLTEKYVKNAQRNIGDTPGPQAVDFRKYMLKTGLSVDRLNYHWQMVSGIANELALETIYTEDSGDRFWKVENILRYFRAIGKKGNFALRFRGGIAQNENSPFVPFVLDSYLTVRGSGNRVARGTAELTLNIEHRHTLKQESWGALQAVGFADLSAWRPGGAALSEVLKKENTVSFVGLGTRLYLKNLNHLILRADFGISVTETRQNGIVIGLGQYF